MDYEEFSGKNIEDAITEACTKFTVTSDRLDYEIIDRGSAGFLGLNSHPAIIKAKPITEEEALKKEEAETVPVVEENKEDIPVQSEVTETAERKPPKDEVKNDLSDEEKQEIISRTDKILKTV